MFWGWDGSRRFLGAGRSGSGGLGTFWGSGRWREFETFGVGRVWGVRGALGEADWVRRIGCGAHRSWRIREPAAARQCVLSELEPKGSDKTACSLLLVLLQGAVWFKDPSLRSG